MRRKLGISIIDIYIVKKFLGTFFFSIALILSIAVIFDFSEKIRDDVDRKFGVYLEREVNVV